MATLEKQKKWMFRGEGNCSLVLANCEEKSVYRFPKKNHWGKEKSPDAQSKAERIHMELQSVVDYMTNIMQPLLGSNYVVLPVLVAIPDGLSEEAEREVINSRPAHRKGKEVQSYTVEPVSKSALILPDLSYVIGYEVSPTTGATISVEIKPKKAFMHSSESFIQTKNLERFQVCKFCMHQRLKAKEGQWPKTSRYCPLDLFSGDIERMRHSLLALADTPQNNFRICLNGEEVHGAWRKQDFNIVLETLFGPGTNGHNNGNSRPKNLQLLDLIIEALLSVPHGSESNDGRSDVPLVEFPAQYCQNSSYVQQQQKHQLHGQNGKKFTLVKGCVLERVLSVQRMDDLDIHGVFPIYQKLEEHLQHHSEESSSWCLDGPYEYESWLGPCEKCGVQTCSSNCSLEKQDPIAEAVNKVKRFLISKTMQDCSIMVALQRVSEKTSGKYSYLTDPQGRLYQFSVSIIDLDPKPFNKILTYYRQDARISKAYKEAEDKMQAPTFLE
ncbi:hypothetical protein CHS0354_029650 [Potamilus streckersoni]|uniref:Inositol-pentakisphosphate 2-kinase n=1 Tax=Potamilus streckersoni TaxID=2493646 RepID=A0AAE0RU56_9BIVA|nr:hypothetical protein CHS0354_029650 [Potamilus streckersoni]